MKVLCFYPRERSYARNGLLDRLLESLLRLKAEIELVSVSFQSEAVPPSFPERQVHGSQLFISAKDFRECAWKIHQYSTSRNWQRITKRGHHLFIGFGAISALVAERLPETRPRFILVDRLDAHWFHQRLHCGDTESQARLAAIESAYHQRVEIGLLQPCRRIITERTLTPVLRDSGWQPSSNLEVMTVPGFLRQNMDVLSAQ